MFTHLDLFAGIGGFSRAVHWLGGTTVGFVEWDAWNRRVLAKHWPEARFHGDIRTFTAATLREWGIATDHVGEWRVHDSISIRQQQRPEGALQAGRDAARGEGESRTIDLITGGYPCQPFSLAGQRLGAEDDRHLWPEMRRVVNLVRPRWVLAENVAGHITMGLDTVLAELEADGYACGAVVIPACAVNALHRRDRVWIMAHAEGGSRIPAAHGGSSGEGGAARLEVAGSGSRFAGPGADEGVADADQDRSESARRTERVSAQLHEPNGAGPQQSWAVADTQSQRSQGHGRLGEVPGGRVAETDVPGGRTGQAPRTLDPRIDGLSAGLVRRLAAGPAGDTGPEPGSDDQGMGESWGSGRDSHAGGEGREAGLHRGGWEVPDLIRQAWADGTWERDLPRVVADEPERRQKLQAAGNAIVPLVAYEILRVMIGADDAA